MQSQYFPGLEFKNAEAMDRAEYGFLSTRGALMRLTLFCGTCGAGHTRCTCNDPEHIHCCRKCGGEAMPRHAVIEPEAV